MKIKKNILKEYIKDRIRKLIKEDEMPMMPTVAGGKSIADERKKLHLLNRLPILRKTLNSLLSPSFEQYISDLTLEAPIPATFKILLTNGVDFNLIYSGGSDNMKFDSKNGGFIAQIAGKKYDLSSTSDLQQATGKLSQQLTLTPAPEKEPEEDPGKAAFEPTGGTGGGGEPGTFPGGNKVPELGVEVPGGEDFPELGDLEGGDDEGESVDIPAIPDEEN